MTDTEIPKPLTREEIISLNECKPNEAVAIYGWDRIVSTLVFCNVLRKRLETSSCK